MTTKPNILFIASWYPSEVSPQAGNFIRNHAQALSINNNIAVIHAVSRDQEQATEIEVNKVNDVLEVIVYYRKIKTSGLFAQRKKFKSQMSAYSEAYKKVTETMPVDLVHVNVTFPAGLFALQLKKKHKLPFIITEHWTAFLDSDPIQLSGIQKQLIKKICRQSEAFCPVSNDLMLAMKNFGIQGDYHVIPNVVNTDLFNYKEKISTDTKQLLHISNLKEEHKNISGILRTIKALSEQRSDFKLLIAGNGDIDFYKEKAKEMSISTSALEFKGEQTPDQVAGLMQESDLFVLFSNYENLPCVISEAHCCGIPVVSTDVGGTSEMINHDNGRLINASDEKALLLVLNEVIDHQSNFDGETIAKEAAALYGAHVIVESYQKVYKNVLS